MNDQIKLTEKETQLLNGIKTGMDAENCGWFHEILPSIGWADDHSAAAVLGSLVKKGLVKNDVIREKGLPTCTWVWLNGYDMCSGEKL